MTRATARHLGPVSDEAHEDPDSTLRDGGGVSISYTGADGAVHGGTPMTLDEFHDAAARRFGPPIDGEFVIPAATLLPPLQAVLAHAADDPDSEMHRIRLTITGAGDILLSATTGYTLAVARIPAKYIDTDEDDLGVIWTADLTPADAKLIARLFKPAKDTALDIRITGGDGKVTVTDVTGLFNGRSLSVPQPLITDHTPDVIRTMRLHLTAAPERGPQYRETPGQAWTRIGASATALGLGPVLDTGTKGSFIARIGTEFIAIVSAARQDEQVEGKARNSWMVRLPAGDPDLFSDRDGADQ